MALRMTCPECDAVLQLSNSSAGAKVRCPKCKAVFSPAAPKIKEAKAVDDESDKSQPAKPARRKPASPIKAGKPKSAPRSKTDEEGSDSRKTQRGGKPWMLIGLGVVVVGFLFLGMLSAGGLYWYLNSQPAQKGPDQIAKIDNKDKAPDQAKKDKKDPEIKEPNQEPKKDPEKKKPD